MADERGPISSSDEHEALPLAPDATEGFFEEEPPEVELRRAYQRVVLRALLFGLLVCVVGLSAAYTAPDVAYFFTGGSAPLDVGNLRERRARGEPLLGIPSNTYVAIHDQAMTYVVETASERYFVDPTYNIITRTERALSRGAPAATLPGSAADAWRPEGRHGTGFSGEGRLLRADRAPVWARGIYEAYEGAIGRPPQDVHLFLEGDRPHDYWSYAVLNGLALLLLVVQAISLFRAHRTWRTLRRIA